MPAAPINTLLLVSTADTDLLAARAAGAGFRTANPARTGPDALPALLDGVAAASRFLAAGGPENLARLARYLDAAVRGADPAKTPTLRAQIWELVTSTQLHRDLHQEAMPGAAEFDDFVLHIDGYLCEIKDVQIRDGLHVLGRVPEGDELVNDVLAIVRARQVFGGVHGALPGLRRADRGRAGPARGRRGRPRPRRRARSRRAHPRRGARRRRVGCERISPR